ncbi:MAG: glycosyltransferase family 4 protein [Gemmatimonadota bacterium]|nr:glycosyltransferase family 4 protein [Gemmatimonadota bacterium]
MMMLNAGRGSGEVARQQARQLIARGHEVLFMHPGVGEGVDGAAKYDVALPGPHLPVHEYLPSAGPAQKAVSEMAYEEASDLVPYYERALERHIEGADIVVGHHANLVALATHRVCTRAGKPYVLFLHGTGIEPRLHGGYDDRLWREIEQAIREAAGLLVTTEYVRDALVRSVVPVPPERFLVLPCGIDLDEFNPERRGDAVRRHDLRDPYVICPGALTLSKGPQNVVAASEQYGDLAPTIFIGDGELRPQLERDLGSRGRFLGFVSSEDKAELITGATLLVAAPEKKEHFGIIYAEALAGGTPCVAYRGGGVDSIVTPDCGILTTRDPVALGQAVRRLLEDEPRRLAMKEEARRLAEGRFDAVELGGVLEDWLLRLVREDAAVV